MRKTACYLFISLMATVATNTAHAGCVGPSVMGECVSGTYVQGYDSGKSSGNNNNSEYRGTSGAQYQYDIRNPVDRNRYSSDISAQRRDQVEGYVDRTQDRSRGQYGGGYLGR
jgi:hypothetical protein